MRSKKARLQKKGIMTFLRVNRDMLAGNPGFLQSSYHLFLFVRIETDIGVDAEDQKMLLPAPVEEGGEIPSTRVLDQVEILPEIHNSKVGIGIEPFYKFSSLVEHV